MSAKSILRRKNIDPNEAVLLITAEEALESIAEAVEEYCPSVRLENLTKEELFSLLWRYARCVVLYHPEGGHQERATLLRNAKILRKYGVETEEIEQLNFC